MEELAQNGATLMWWAIAGGAARDAAPFGAADQVMKAGPSVRLWNPPQVGHAAWLTSTSSVDRTVSGRSVEPAAGSACGAVDESEGPGTCNSGAAVADTLARSGPETGAGRAAFSAGAGMPWLRPGAGIGVGWERSTLGAGTGRSSARAGGRRRDALVLFKVLGREKLLHGHGRGRKEPRQIKVGGLVRRAQGRAWAGLCAVGFCFALDVVLAAAGSGIKATRTT